MRRRAGFLVTLVVALAGAAVMVPAARADTSHVQVRSNFFEPQSVTIRPGDTVTWAFADSGHTVTSVDRAGAETFDSGSGSLGETFSHTYAAEGIWTYYCKLHGADRSGMWGEVVVDDGLAPAPTSSLPATTTTTVDPADVVEVPEEEPTLTAALKAVPVGGVISLAPGGHIGAVRVGTPGVTIRGRGASAAEVVVEGWDGTRTRGSIGIDVVADGVRVENLTVARFGSTGMRFHEVDRFAVEDVVIQGNPTLGVLAEESRRGQLRRVVVEDAATGIEIRRCGECDTVIDRITAVGGAEAAAGVRITDAGGVVVSRSIVDGFGTGILLRSSDPRTGAPQRGAHIVGNEVVAGHTGIHVDGGWHDVIESNRTRGSLYGIRVTGVPIPAHEVRVAGNAVDAIRAGLSWDGAGFAVCFTGNVDDSSGEPAEPTSDPPFLQTIAAC